jgi:helix-turn-helix protein
MVSDEEVGVRSRRLAAALEPVAGQVYFSPECHAAYAALGFSPSPGSNGQVAFPDGAAYFTSRGSVMGQVPGEVVAAAFGVFDPGAVIPAVTYGWSLTDAETICGARTSGAVAQLARILGEDPAGLARATALLDKGGAPLAPAGKPLFAGLVAIGLPGSALGDMWRLADRLREYRGDAHTAAWASAGFDATEIGLLTELYWGLPLRSYVRTRAWSDGDLDAAEGRLVECGLIAGGAMTAAGAAAREDVERATDRQCRPLVDALGDDLDDLVGLLLPWGEAIRAGGGYPAAGPHDLARAVARP